MKNRKNQFRSIILCLILTLGLVLLFTGAGGQQSSSSSPAGKPELHFIVSMEPYHKDYNEVLAYQEYAKISPAVIRWEGVPSVNFPEKRNLLLASGDLPDAFFRGGFSNNDLLKYGSEGVFVALSKIIPKSAPNFNNVMNQMPEVRKGVTQSNGEIYGFPFICTLKSADYSGKMFYRQDWLQKLNAKFPVTVDDLYNLCIKVRDTDLNGNGKKDEIPISIVDGPNLLVQVFHGYFGLMNRGAMHTNIDMDPKTNTLRFIPTAPAYRQMLETLSKFYNEGLLDQEFFTGTSAKFAAKQVEDKIFAFPFPNPSIMAADKEMLFRVGDVLKGPNGDQIATPVSSGLRTGGAYVITNKCKTPDVAAAWADYFFSEAGKPFFYLGVEGKSYYYDEKLKDYNYYDHLLRDPTGLPMNQATAPYLNGWGGGHPGFQPQEKFPHTAAKLPEAMRATNAALQYFPKEIWASFTYTVKENEDMLYITNDINKYISEMRAQFISKGITDAQWNEYVAKFNNMDLKKYMDIYNAAYQRYIK